MVVAVGGGNFATLDSSSTDPKPHSGAIRYSDNGKALWMSKPDLHFVVSGQAVLAIDGVPHKRSLNLLLAAAKRPIISTLAVLAVVGGGVWWWRKRRKGRAA